jgi:peptidyl-prolyl cis-trans isomerase B (cyclophilin B)
VPKSTKRERQRQNRDARREAMLEAEKRRRRWKAARNGGIVFVALLVVLLVVTLTRGDDDSDTENASSTSARPTNFATTCDTALPEKAASNDLPKPGMGIDTSKQYTAVLHTSEGDIPITLDAATAPKTVNSFVYLACKGFYNGTTFHRIVTDFVDQGGDPEGTGSGGPGYRLPDEPPTDGYVAGSVAMANSGSGTTGSQFFLVVSDAGAQSLNASGSDPYLYSALGTMDPAGLQVAQLINTFGSADGAGTPTKTVTINGVTVTEA